MNAAQRRPVHGMIGKPLAALFALGVAVRNRRFDRGKNITEPAVTTISVGNIAAGGSGKTPTVQWIVRELLAGGARPAVVLRGYGATKDGFSDEQAEHAAKLPGVHVVANPDRVAAIAELAAQNAADCVVLDDGFQHRRCGRKLDVVLVDAVNDPWNDAPLPAGYLREPTSSLKRADAVVLTHADRVRPERLDALRRLVLRDHGHPPVALAAHRWEGFDTLEPGGSTTKTPTGWIENKRVVAACAIAKPDRFFAQLREKNAQIAAQHVYNDHDPLGGGKTAEIVASARTHGVDAIVCTAKDWGKLERAGVAWPVTVARPRLAIDVFEGAAELRALVLGAASRPMKEHE